MLVLAICCMSLLIVGMDNTIVNVALTSIQRSLHASLTDLQWTIDAYTLVLASLLMLSGSTADRLGRRRTFQTGLAIFVFLRLSGDPTAELAGDNATPERIEALRQSLGLNRSVVEQFGIWLTRLRCIQDDFRCR